MSTFQAVHYRASDGSEPVSDFIDRLTIKRQVALDHQIDRLNMLGPDFPHLPFPHSSQVAGELRELRCHFGREHYRILYRRSHDRSCCCTSSRRTQGRSLRLRCRSPRSAGPTSRRGWMPIGGNPRGRPATTHRDRALTVFTDIGKLLAWRAFEARWGRRRLRPGGGAPLVAPRTTGSSGVWQASRSWRDS